MGPFDIAMMGVFTGLIFVVGSLVVILTIVMAQIRYRRRRAEMLHQERLMALEKGIPLPTDSLDVPKKRRPYIRGLVFTAVGVGIIIMGGLDTDTDLIGIGAIFLLVGIALIGRRLGSPSGTLCRNAKSCHRCRTSAPATVPPRIRPDRNEVCLEIDRRCNSQRRFFIFKRGD